MKIRIEDRLFDRTLQVEVGSETTVEILKLKISSGFSLNYNYIFLSHEGRKLTETGKTMGELGVEEGSKVDLEIRVGQESLARVRSQISNLSNKITSDENILEKILELSPRFAEFMLNQDLENASMVFLTEEGLSKKLLSFISPPSSTLETHLNDPLSADYQRKIEEQIHNERFNIIRQETYENYPELFVPAELIFIKSIFNGVPAEVLIDTGAQTTIISKSFAERAGILKLVDSSFKTMTVGVGSQMSLGKIWQLQMQISGCFFMISATVLADFPYDVLMGIDMMKRHHCVIKLGECKICFGSAGVEADFIKDHLVTKREFQLPKKN